MLKFYFLIESGLYLSWEEYNSELGSLQLGGVLLYQA
jgi:hypothetical protein